MNYCNQGYDAKARKETASREIGGNMTPEFESLMNDPDLEAERGPGGTLIFLDGEQFCVVGPDFVSMEGSGCYAFGSTREEAIANYRSRMTDR